MELSILFDNVIKQCDVFWIYLLQMIGMYFLASTSYCFITLAIEVCQPSLFTYTAFCPAYIRKVF